MASQLMRLSRIIPRGLVLVIVAMALLQAAILPAGRFWAAQVRAPERKSPAQGEKIFVSSCGTCHGVDGRGGEHAPNIATNPAVQHLSDAGLNRIVENGILSAGMPSFRALGPKGVKAVVGYLRVLQGRQSTTTVPGSPAHGKELFFGRAQCSTCHLIHGEGGFLGPDLSSYALSHSPHDIREAIVNPNKNLRPDEDTVVAVTRNGHKFVGVARNEDNFSLQLQTADGSFHLLMKSSLALLRHEPYSLMPSDYASRLSAADLNDLVSFLVEVSEGENGRGLSSH
ncbi:MAG: c-type cytochrome [Terriglobia bacterium]